MIWGQDKSENSEKFESSDDSQRDFQIEVNNSAISKPLTARALPDDLGRIDRKK